MNQATRAEKLSNIVVFGKKEEWKPSHVCTDTWQHERSDTNRGDGEGVVQE